MYLYLILNYTNSRKMLQVKLSQALRIYIEIMPSVYIQFLLTIWVVLIITAQQKPSDKL